MTLDLEDEAGKFAQELQQLLDDVLPMPTDADPASRQVAATIGQISDGRTSFALEVGTGGGGPAGPVALLFGGKKTADSPRVELLHLGVWSATVRPASTGSGRRTAAVRIARATRGADLLLSPWGCVSLGIDASEGGDHAAEPMRVAPYSVAPTRAPPAARPGR